jgi:ribosome-associated protein
MKDVSIRTDYITLGQLLKLADFAATGGEAKHMLLEGRVRVNGETETRRGRKIRPGDTVEAEGRGALRVTRARED